LPNGPYHWEARAPDGALLEGNVLLTALDEVPLQIRFP
jgi:hypothetical protein